MPTYEYRCPKGHEFEVFQRMSDDPVAPCPTCGKDAERLISAGAGLLFKGSGFYITDYRNDAYKKKADADAPKAAESKTAESKTAESKTAKSTSSASKSESKKSEGPSGGASSGSGGSD